MNHRDSQDSANGSFHRAAEVEAACAAGGASGLPLASFVFFVSSWFILAAAGEVE